MVIFWKFATKYIRKNRFLVILKRAKKENGTCPILSFPPYEDTFSINNIKLIAAWRQFREYSEQLKGRRQKMKNFCKKNLRNSEFYLFTFPLKVWKFSCSFFYKDWLALPFSELFISAVQFEWTEIKYKTVYNQQTWTEMQEINNFDNFIANICRSFLLQQPLVDLNEKSLDNVFK